MGTSSEMSNNHHFPAASAMEGITVYYPRMHGVQWGCFFVSMPSNPVEVWRNQQDQTIVMLNNQKLRRTWPSQEQTMSQTCSDLQAKCPTIFLCLSAFQPSPGSQS